MKEIDIYPLLTGMKIPVAYDHFVNDDTLPPFILYRNDDTETFKADDKTYYKENSYIVDLVTEKKDVSVEEQLETIFNNNNIPFDKVEDYIESQKIFQIRYFI